MQKDPWLRQKKIHTAPVPKLKEKKARKWRILPILWRAFKKTSMVIGAVVILSSIMMSWMFSSVVEGVDAQLPQQMVLYMELEGALGDLPQGGGFADPFVENNKTVKNYIDALDRARTDPRVEGVYARFDDIQLSIAHVQELRQAIHNFRESGKFAFVYASSYNQGVGGYFLAAAFEEIWIQPMGIVVIAGMNAEMPYIRGVLDKLGIEPQIYKRKKYKGAYDVLTETEMPDPSRETMETLITDIADVLKTGISQDKGISGAEFKSLVDKGLFLADEAVEAKLIDRADYADKLVGKINEIVTGDPENENLSYIKFDSYVNEMVEEKRRARESFFGTETQAGSQKPGVALVYAVGAIMDSEDAGDGIAGAKEIALALHGAARNDDIDAVVLRVDSPGGSPVASETILRAVEKVQEEGKTVVVSMGPTAASGGYWIASYADEIFVLPTTITGSIGVIGGKFSLKKLWEIWGVNWDSVSWGDNAAIWSMNEPFSESEAERINAMMDNVYNNFIKRVAKGRDMTESEVDSIAGGRVWSGKSAVDIGLADQFGSLNDAIDYAAVQAGGSSRHDVNVVVMPKPLSTIERLIKLLDGQVQAGESLRLQAELFKNILPNIHDVMMLQTMKNGAIYDPVRVQ